MEKHKVVSSTTTLFIFLFLAFKGSFCLDSPFYESCVPKDCGDGMNISYPFYLKGLQSPFCSYPGFKLRCNNNGSSVIRISGNSYLVKHIDYNNHSIRLVSTPDITCLSKVLTNLTLDPGRFVLDKSSPTSKLVFLTNCSNVLPMNLTRYRIDGSCDQSINQLVMLKNDRSLGIGKEVCSKVVVAPVEMRGGKGGMVDGGNYVKVVERGFRMRWLAADCGVCEHSGGKCGFDMTAFQFQCFCSYGNETSSCKTDAGGQRKTVVLASALSAVASAILVLIILCFVRKFIWRRKTTDLVNVEDFLRNHEFLAPNRYSYLQIKKMTNSFKVKLGQGGFGSVFKGALSNGNLVAVKVLSELKGDGGDFINEVASVGRTCHVNIVTLVGFCYDSNHRALVYEFMPNGSLEKFIYDRASTSNSKLGWEKLHQIAIGIARGLEYLHSGCNTRILHFDIKPHNILLDQDLYPKISDFGLAKLFLEKRSMVSISHTRGTMGYIAPELFSRNFGQVSHKSDVYSYGMMILEMVGGRKNIEVEVDHYSEIYFPHWIYKRIELDEQFGLHGITSDEESEMARKMIIVGLWCIQNNPLSRPTMTKVLEMLEGDLASLEIPPKPYISSPPRPNTSTSIDLSRI